MENLNVIKDRIAKLLKMAKDTSSPAEAAIAASRARRLMDIHQIDEYDISEKISEQFISKGVTRFFAAVPYHLQPLCVAVAKLNDCQARFERGYVDFKKTSSDVKKWGSRIIFQGYESDVELAEQMFNFLSSEIDSLCKKYVTKLGIIGRYPVGIGSEYKNGATTAIHQSIYALIKERELLFSEAAKGTDSGSRGLMVLKANAVAEHFGAAEYSNKVKGASSVDAWQQEHARRNGMIDGAKVEIRKRIDD